jgi:hypothetical protein
MVESVSPEFQQTIDTFAARRGKWLLRRGNVRAQAAAILQAIKGEAPPYPVPDPDALEPEEVATDPLDPEDPQLQKPEEAYGTVLQNGQYLVACLVDLRTYLRDKTPIKHTTAVRVVPFPAGITFPVALRDKIRYDTDNTLLIFQGKMTQQERDTLRQLLTQGGVADAANSATRLYEQSQSDELSQLDVLGLEKFIDFLQAKVGRANDKVDTGFLRVQTDIYRIRQIMLGTSAATRLATSPALASIAQGESAVATREDIAAFRKATQTTSTREVSNMSTSGEDPANAGSTAETERNIAGGANVVRANPSRSGETFLSGELAMARTEASEVASGGRLREESARPLTIAETLRGEAARGTTGLFTTKTIMQEDIREQSPIVGKAYDFRTLSIAERLAQPPANEAKSATVAGKYEVIQGVVDLDIAVDDLEVPGFRQNDQEVRKSFADIKEGGLLAEILAGTHDPDPTDGDEAAYFAAGVRAIDHTVATLRVLEGRVQAYQSAIEACRKTLATLRELATQVDRRLKVIGDTLAETRHDVAVARALLAEEQQRVAAINARRDRIVAEHVPFLAMHRPRVVESRVDTPVRILNPGLAETSIPACLARAVEAPPELRAMVELWREAPLKWFTDVQKWLDKFDRLDILQNNVHSAKMRAQMQSTAVQTAALKGSGSGPLGQAMHKVFLAQEQTLRQYRQQTAELDLRLIVGQSWKQSRDQARDVLSLGDMMDASSHPDVAQLASNTLANMTRIAACLYASFSAVLPSVRLDWAERLSQYDTPVHLRDLSSLPRWGEIDYLERHEMQTLVDWLYQRVDVRQSEAVALMSDLVRVCILLASHAPVHQILAGYVAKPTTVQVGGRVELGVDIARVRVGMQVLVYTGTQTVARGVVEDLATGKATARIVQTSGASVQIEQGARVQFANPEGFERNPLTMDKTALRSAGAPETSESFHRGG